MLDPRLDRAPCGYVCVADDGTMIEVNATLASMLGYPPGALDGTGLEQILSPGGRIFYQTHVFPLLRLHGIAEELYLPLRTRSGEDLPTLMNAARRDRDGSTVNECVFVRMIQRHEFEEQLIQARRLAEEANSAKAKFLSMMSHDLRTPLTAVSGNADLVATGAFGPANEQQREAMAFIKAACGELLRMINDILSFAQLGSGRVKVHPAEVSVASAVARAEALVRLRLQEAEIAFESAVDGDLAVCADPDRLQQILLNLLTNAAKFTPPGGRISVTAQRQNERVRIHVADTGIGIEREQLSRIFEPFVQVGDSAGTGNGVGLGLAISRELARAMEGDLTAESTPGEGSVFAIDLPAAPAKVGA